MNSELGTDNGEARRRTNNIPDDTTLFLSSEDTSRNVANNIISIRMDTRSTI